MTLPSGGNTAEYLLCRAAHRIKRVRKSHEANSTEIFETVEAFSFLAKSI